MTPLALDNALLSIIVAGFTLGILYVVVELVTWRFRRVAEIKALLSLKHLYQRSSRLTRRLVPKKRADRSR